MKTNDTSPIWTPRPNTRVDLPDLCFMHGGPVGMHLPEHEHREVQLELHFLARPAGMQHHAAHTPAFFKLIPSGKSHVGRWSDGNEVVVVLLGSEYIARATDAVARSASSSILDADCAVDPVLQSLGMTLRREFLGGGLEDQCTWKHWGSFSAVKSHGMDHTPGGAEGERETDTGTTSPHNRDNQRGASSDDSISGS